VVGVLTKITNAGYYWPKMHMDAVEELRKCKSCQKFAPMALRPKNDRVPVVATGRFQKWGFDIVGPFPEAAGRLNFLTVAMDYFTKWVEAKLLATITAANVKEILWEHIICRFGCRYIWSVTMDDNSRTKISKNRAWSFKSSRYSRQWRTPKSMVK
jgi:hypothetical protein